jgi:thioredoxin
MKNHVIELDTSSFDSQVFMGTKPAWITFGAKWCPPCKAFGPTHEIIAHQFNGQVLSGHVDIDDYPALANQYDIKSVPTHILFKDGIEVKRMQGALVRSAVETAYIDLIG